MAKTMKHLLPSYVSDRHRPALALPTKKPTWINQISLIRESNHQRRHNQRLNPVHLRKQLIHYTVSRHSSIPGAKQMEANCEYLLSEVITRAIR